MHPQSTYNGRHIPQARHGWFTHAEGKEAYHRRVIKRDLELRLVLWDIDFTLIDPCGFGKRAMTAALQQLHGIEVEAAIPSHGRTDRAILADYLTAAGLALEGLGPLCRRAGAVAEERAADFTGYGGRALPGAATATATLATISGVVQSVLTGNLRRIGLVKLTEADLLTGLDLDVAAFGDAHTVRADLVQISVDSAARKYATPPESIRPVLVGDTPLDVEAALATGAVAVGVASGVCPADELSAAGAHLVLPDLSDISALVALLA